MAGGGGNDTLAGGAITDRYVFAGDFGADTVTDYDAKRERLDLSAYTAAATPQSFADLLVTKVGTGVQPSFDVDHDGIADVADVDGDGDTETVSIDLLNTKTTAIDAGDFLF